jgi:ABC-type uncharacterized transport system substrate-binding protein
MRPSTWLAIPVTMLLSAVPAYADITTMDLQVAARALSFLDDPMTGRVRVGIVYSPDSPRSRSQAEQVGADMSDGLKVGNVVLVPILVPIDEATAADVDLFLLTEHMPPTDDRLAGVSRSRQIACITTDLDQVRKGTCAIAVQSRPKIEIVVNRDAAIGSGLKFATAFRVMVTEI